MRRVLPLTFTALVLSATPATAGWSPDRLQTQAGRAGSVSVASGSGDRIALGWSRSLNDGPRAELRLGRARDGFTATPMVIDPRALGAPQPAYVGDGAFALAWPRRLEGRTPRSRGLLLRLRTVDRRGRLRPTTRLTRGGESASVPSWVDGPGAALQWSRETRSDGVLVTPDGVRRLRLPAPAGSEPGAAVGLATLSWVRDGRVLVSDRDASGYSDPQTLAVGDDVNLTRTVRVSGATLVLWRRGTTLLVAARPRDGAPFGPARQLLASTTDAAAVAVTATNEVLVVAPTGDSSGVGDLRLLRVGADGAPLAPDRSLGRGRLARVVVDGIGSAFVAWTSPERTRSITVRRIAAGGILGGPQRLAAASDLGGRAALAATREGGAVLAWVMRGQVHARTYRP